VSFPTGSSKADQLARIQASTVTLQNLNGPGKGCPAASTTFVAQQQAIQAAPDNTSSSPEAGSPATPAPAPPSGSAVPDIAALAPSLGATAGKNPDGSLHSQRLDIKFTFHLIGAGNCDGAVNGADGKPVKVPCSCPPSQNAYIAALTANVKAGKAVNNPSLKVTFPTSNSKADQLARVTAAVITLQNLNGPGKGCPVASTTLLVRDQLQSLLCLIIF